MSSVTVEINGKETISKAAQDATASLKQMSDDSKGIFDNVVVTAGNVVEAVGRIASTVSSFFTEYAEQQKAIMTFNAAVNQSAQMSEGATERLREYAAAMALKTGADDDAVLSMIAFLSTSGRTEDQIRKVIAAAADMSTVTGSDLKTSVEQINKTFSGSARELGTFVDGMKELSAEELKSGAAVDLISQKYGGLADSMGGSASVALGNLKNTLDDTKAALGEALMPAVQPTLEWLVKFLNDPVIPAIQGFAPIVQVAFETVEKIITAFKPIVEPIFSWLGGIFDNVLIQNINTFLDQIKLVIDMLVAIINGDWSTAWTDAKNIVTNAIEIIQRSLKPVTDIAKKIWDGVKNVWSTAWESLKSAVKAPIEAILKFFDPIIDAVNKVINGIQTAIQFVSGEKRVGNYLVDKNNKLIGEYVVINGTEMLKRYASGTSGAEPGWAVVGEEGPELMLFNGGEQVISNDKLKSMPGYAAGTIDLIGGSTEIWNIIISLVTQFTDLIKPLDSIKAILDPLNTIFASMMEVLGPLINTILAPIVGALRTIGVFLGTILAPIFSAFSPIITALAAGFVWFYNNVMLPVGNAIITVGNWMYNAVANTVNTLLGWLGFHLNTIALSSGTLSEISLSELSNTGVTPYTGAGGTSGSTANYTKQRDINVYVTLNTAALVGNDGIDEFALIIGRSLKSAGVLGVT